MTLSIASIDLRSSNPDLAFYLLIINLRAVANWSGQDVGFGPQVVPANFSITNSAFRPTTNLLIPAVLPGQPPIIFAAFIS